MNHYNPPSPRVTVSMTTDGMRSRSHTKTGRSLVICQSKFMNLLMKAIGAEIVDCVVQGVVNLLYMYTNLVMSVELACLNHICVQQWIDHMKA